MKTKMTVLNNLNKLLCVALILSPVLATADIDAGNIAQTPSQSSNSLLAAQPAIAKPNLYKGDDMSADSSAQNKDILIEVPKNVIGGSSHQVNGISPYLGINY